MTQKSFIIYKACTDLFEELKKSEYATTKSGEQWKEIEYPDLLTNTNINTNTNTYYQNYNKYVSDQGKIMTCDGIIKEFVDGSMYPNNYIPIYLKMDITKVSGSAILLHRIVCFNFNGPPKDWLTYTVDHLDRNRMNNRASNLAWKNIQEQLNNRRHRKYLVTDKSGKIYKSLAEYSRISNIKHYTLRHTHSAENYEIHVEEKEMKNAVISKIDYVRKPSMPSEQQYSCYLMFTQQNKTIEDIATEKNIKITTAISYIANQYRNQDRPFFLQKLNLNNNKIYTIIEKLDFYKTIETKEGKMKYWIDEFIPFLDSLKVINHDLVVKLVRRFVPI
jgi:hypothetical protein